METSGSFSPGGEEQFTQETTHEGLDNQFFFNTLEPVLGTEEREYHFVDSVEDLHELGLTTEDLEDLDEEELEELGIDLGDSFIWQRALDDCPEGWDNFLLDPDEDDDAWDMADSWLE